MDYVLDNSTVFELRTCIICSPRYPLNSREDGGHLLVMPKRYITERFECNPIEAIELTAATMIAGEAIKTIIGVEKVNYQEMGNWGIKKSKLSILHVHIFGRAKKQIYQVRGESITFKPEGHPIYHEVYSPYTSIELEDIERYIKNSITTSKYTAILNAAYQITLDK